MRFSLQDSASRPTMLTVMDRTSPDAAAAPSVLTPPVVVIPAQRSPTSPSPAAPALRTPSLPAPPRRDETPVATPRPERRTSKLLVLVLVLLAPLLVGSAAASPDEGTVRAYFFGDSIMSGTGSSPQRPVMARIAAARLGWDVEVDAWGGTGFTTTGRWPGYLERLRRPGAMAGTYDVVLVEGGTNDARVGSSPTAIRDAVRAVVDEVRTRQPKAQIVLMGAYDPPGVVDLRRAVADSAVRDVATELELPFFSPLSGGWHNGQDPRRFLHADGLHPNTTGYTVMAERLAGALRGAVPELSGT
jgi:acyl-CoA thioesterase I